MIYAIAFAGVRKELPEGSARQPVGGRAASLALIQQLCINDEAPPPPPLGPLLQLGSFKNKKKENATMETLSVPKQSDAVSPASLSADIPLLRNVICAVCRRENVLLHLMSQVCEGSSGGTGGGRSSSSLRETN